jgi:hypothetical protein
MVKDHPLDLVQPELSNIKALGVIITTLGFDVDNFGGVDSEHIGQLGMMISESVRNIENKLDKCFDPGQAEASEKAAGE